MKIFYWIKQHPYRTITLFFIALVMVNLIIFLIQTNSHTNTSNDNNYTINGMPDKDTFTKAFNILQDGDTININSGTYTISTPVTSGAKNILIEGSDPQKLTIIKCVAMAFMVGNDNWIFRNLTIETTESYGVGISTFNSKNVFLQNVTINGILYNGDYHVTTQNKKKPDDEIKRGN